MAFNGWQDYAVSDGTGLMRLDPAMPQPSLADWQQIKDQDLAALNAKLRAAGQTELQTAL